MSSHSVFIQNDADSGIVSGDDAEWVNNLIQGKSFHKAEELLFMVYLYFDFISKSKGFLVNFI